MPVMNRIAVVVLVAVLVAPAVAAAQDPDGVRPWLAARSAAPGLGPLICRVEGVAGGMREGENDAGAVYQGGVRLGRAGS